MRLLDPADICGSVQVPCCLLPHSYRLDSMVLGFGLGNKHLLFFTKFYIYIYKFCMYYLHTVYVHIHFSMCKQLPI